MRLPALLIPLALALLGITGCATDPERDPTLPISVAEIPYNVSPLDQIEITYRDGSSESFVVDQDGRLTLGNGESIPAAGQPAEIVVRRIRDRYPSATVVDLTEFRTNQITVLGEVFHQIHTDLGDGPLRVMDAIASANGFTPLANKRRVRLLRQNAGFVEVYEFDLREMLLGQALAQNFLLEPGDVITVPRNFL